MSIPIQLMDESTIGRSFQIAALGSLIHTSDTLRDVILTQIHTDRIELSVQQCEELLSQIKQHLELIGKDRPQRLYPKLYKAGVNDAKILREAGLVTSNKLNNLTVEELAKSVENIKCDSLTKDTNIPMLLRPFIFSFYRSGRKPKKTNVISLLVAVVGAVTSLTAAFNLEKKQVEIYIVPDGTTESLEYAGLFYNLMYSSKVNRKVNRVINDIVRAKELTGISVEQALLMAVMFHALQDLDITLELKKVEGFEKFLLVKVAAERRPQVIYATPITLTSRFEALLQSFRATVLDESDKWEVLLGVLENIDSLIVSLLSQRVMDEAVRRVLAESASSCLNELYMFTESWETSCLLSCSSDLVRLYASATSKEPELEERVMMLLRRISLII